MISEIMAILETTERPLCARDVAEIMDNPSLHGTRQVTNALGRLYNQGWVDRLKIKKRGQLTYFYAPSERWLE